MLGCNYSKYFLSPVNWRFFKGESLALTYSRVIVFLLGVYNTSLTLESVYVAAFSSKSLATCDSRSLSF